MPTPIDIFFNPVALTCLAIYGLLMLWEFLFPARALPRVPYWQLRGLTACVVFFLLSSYLPLLWDGTLARYRLFDATAWPLWVQVAGGIVVYQFALYWWHRCMHGSDFLWRSFHQFHHSAERLDTFSAFWTGPLDVAGFTLLGSLAFVLVIGVSAEAAVYALYINFFFSVFQHANVRTPRWLGYLVQRPESHSRHHGRGIHEGNYSDLPVFDLLFGTFHNPVRHFETGLYPGASGRVVDMLLWRDLGAAQEGRSAK